MSDKTTPDFTALADRIEQAFAKAFTPKAETVYLDMSDSYHNSTAWSDPPGLAKISVGPRERWPGDEPQKGEKPGPTKHEVAWVHSALPGRQFESAREIVAALRAAAKEARANG